MEYGLAAVIGYLFGCSNMAWYLGKIRRADLRGGGSRNLGASNATVLLGWRAGFVVAVHDVGKALLAVLLVRLLFPELTQGAVVTGAACVMGHIFPFWLGFRGGKGFAPYMGMTLALNWKLGICLILAVAVITLVTDYVVFGTITTVLTVPAYLFFTRGWVPALIAFLATGVILWKHRENYPRMWKGTELGLRSALRGENRLPE